jgi:hypothetical protein
MNLWVVTAEILVCVVAPLLFLYRKGGWPQRAAVPCLLSIPVLWYFTYAPLHELSHLLGTYLAGGEATSVKLIPRFWRGEVAGAWVNHVGLDRDWQQLAMLTAPYLLDVAAALLGIALLRPRRIRNPFAVGFGFMLLCLRPLFDLACESVALLAGMRGDLYHVGRIVGIGATWIWIALSLAVAAVSVFVVLRRYTRFPEPQGADS